MFVFEQNMGPKSVFEKISRFFSRVSVAPTMMKFTQQMHIDVIKLFYLAEFFFFLNIAPEYKKKT